VQNIQTKLINESIIKDDLEFIGDIEKREFLKPKIERLCKLMDTEYKVNFEKMRRQKEEQRRAQAQKYDMQQRSRAA
jgi:hypothetical protein